MTNILVECPALIPSVQVGVLNPLRPLEEAGLCKTRFLRTIKLTRKDIAWCDVYICVRGFESASLHWMSLAKKYRRVTVYFLDDDLLNIPKEAGSRAYFSDLVFRKCMVEMLALADVFWHVNAHLGEKYKPMVNGRLVLSRVPYECTDVRPARYLPARVLYAGSTDHTETVRKYLSPAIRRICEEPRHKEVRFTFIGADPGLTGLDQVDFHPFFLDYDKYRDFVAQGGFQIGLAVVLDDDFYKCKYYNKYIEYTSIGAVGVYTRGEPYTLAIQDGMNGFLCDNSQDDWYRGIVTAIDSAEDRERCLNNARCDLLNNFTFSAVSSELISSIPELVDYAAPHMRWIPCFPYSPKMAFYFGRFHHQWRSIGWAAIPWAFRSLAGILVRSLKRRAND